MKPKILLINLPYIVKDIDANRPKIRSYLAFPYGLLSVATYNKHLADFKIVDCDTEEDHAQAIRTAMTDFSPVVVGFSMMFDNSYKYLKPLLSIVKGISPNVLVFLGGAAASYSYEEILKEQPDIDAICYSEGEVPLNKVLLEGRFVFWTTNHPSWITRSSLQLSREPKISYIDNLDDVIDIDYSFVNPDAYDMKEAFSPFADSKANRKPFFITTSRGCFGKCSFCSNAKIHGRIVRQASVGKLVDHVKYLVDTFGMKTLIIYDDQLLYKPDRAKGLFHRLAQFNLRIEMPNGLSVRYIDAEMAYLMRRAGVDTAYLAIESGSEFVLKKLINKPLELSQVKPAVKALRDNDFFIHGFLVFGMPGETDEHRLETRRFLEDVDLDWIGCNMATPVRGSKLYDDCIKNNWIPKQKISEIVDKAYIINVPGTDPKKIESDVYQMNLDINFHNNRRMRTGDYKVAKRCFEEVLMRYDGHKWAKHYFDICREKLNESD